jgi:hypothetical protein
MVSRKIEIKLGAALALIMTCSTPVAAAQDSTQQELRDLRELVRQQAAAMRSMQHRLDAIEGSQRPAPGTGSVASAAPSSPPAAATPEGQPSGLTVGSPGKVPGKDERNVAVTQQPGNLPGHSTVAGYTTTNVASPGSVPAVPAAPVSSGGEKIKLSISGQVDRMLLFGNDGKSSAVRNVDNTNSSTRFRIVGEGQINDTASGGINVETELRPNSSATTTLTQNLPQPASAVSFTVRQAEAYLQDTRYGGVRLGFGSTASYLTNQVDLSGTGIASYVNVADFDGGFAFRQQGAARVPAAGGGFVLSPSRSYGPAVGAVFNYFDGLGRDDRIRYDSPAWNGFAVSTSAVDGSAFDIALRYSGAFSGNQLAGGLAFADGTSRHHLPLTGVSGFPGAPANLYGYAGVPTGSDGTQNLGTPASPASGDSSANGSLQYNGSVSLLLESGINFTIAGGYRDVNYLDPQGRKLTPTFLFGKIGYLKNLFPEVGLSAVSFDVAQNNQLQFAGDRAMSYSLAFVQNIDAAATEVFLDARLETLHRTFAEYDNLITIGLGARVRF